MIKKLVVLVLGFWIVKKYVVPYFNGNSDADLGTTDFGTTGTTDRGTTDDTL